MSNDFSLGIFSAIWLCFSSGLLSVQAQSIVPDTTLHNNSVVTGGTTAGSNLFHSFEKLSIFKAEVAYFHNNPNIKNIMMQVKDNSISNIQGLIRSNGNTNSFLLNSNGIVYGSFVARTADMRKLANESSFSAINTPKTSLMVQPINTINRITQTCSIQARNNHFTIIGRGGLPASSKEVLNITPTWIDWRIGGSRKIAKKLDDRIQEPLIEATSWQLDANGTVELIASSSHLLSKYTTAARNNIEPCNASSTSSLIR